MIAFISAKNKKTKDSGPLKNVLTVDFFFMFHRLTVVVVVDVTPHSSCCHCVTDVNLLSYSHISVTGSD